MSERGDRLTVGLAQIDSRLGELEANLDKHLQWVEKARQKGVELLVFPELSLTGYRLLHLTPRVAIRPESSPIVHQLVQAAGSLAVVVGLVEIDGSGALYNSALLLDGGQVSHVHRKIYLPTYGIFQEGRFLGAGRRLEVASFKKNRLGLLICEDLWHPELAQRLAQAGSKLIAVPSSGPGRLGAGPTPDSHESWELLTRSTALVNTCWVIYCNRVGWEEGSFYPGGSHIVRPGGDILSRAPFLEEHLLVTEIDLQEADRLRWRLPLLQARRVDVEGPR